MEKFEKINSKFLIADEAVFAKKIEAIKVGGFKNLHVLTDFDKTLTRAMVNDVETPSLISVLRREGYLTSDYPAKAQALFDRYYPIEIDHTISREEKALAMDEWWRAHFELLIQSGLTKADIESAMRSQSVQLRDGVPEFIKKMNDNNVPIVIISASGLGREAIELYLREQNLLLDNVHIVSNGFKWDEQGRAIDIEEPVIHTVNKNETILSNYSFYDQIKERKNVLLFGDALEDVFMVEGLAHNNVLKIGFLNRKIEENRDKFLNAYDAVITGDGDFSEITKIHL